MGSPVANDEWPSLSEKQIEDWVAELRPYNIRELSVMWSQEIEARRLYKALKQVGERLGAEVNSGLGGTDYEGIEILAAPDDPAGPSVLKLCRQLGQPVILNHEDREGRQGEILILIGEKQ